MSESQRSAVDPDQAWKNHVFSAAKSFLKCAVAIDDRPVSSPGGMNTTVEASHTKDAETHGGQEDSGIRGPIPTTPKTAVVKRGGSQSEDAETENDRQLNKGTHKLDLRMLTDSFADQDIVCGVLIPDGVQEDENSFIDRARKMAQSADILIIDWFLKKRDFNTTLKIIEAVLREDKREGGRTRLICIYTGEDQLKDIRGVVRDKIEGGHSFKPNQNDDSVKLKNESTSIVFINKKNINGSNKLNGSFSASEQELPNRLIHEFASLIDGLLPSFAASSVGAIRRNTHGILDTFRAEIDAAYVGNRAITDPSEGVAELVRELLVSELDNQIGFARSADHYLSKKAISLWLGTPNRVRIDCELALTKPGNGQSPNERKVIDANLIRRAACGDIVSLEKPFVIDGQKFKINKKERLKFTWALCESEESANRIEEKFARLAANKREAYGRETTENNWRPSLTLGTLLFTREQEEQQFYMCITRACDTMRISQNKKEVVLLCLKKANKQFNLVVPDSETTNVKLRVPGEFSDMKTVTFKVDGSTRRITATPIACGEGKHFCFESTSDELEYRYLGELRYLRALRDVSEIVRNSTAIGIADSEWLRLSDRF